MAKQEEDDIDYAAVAEQYVKQFDLRYSMVQDRYVVKTKEGNWEFVTETGLAKDEVWCPKLRRQIYGYLRRNNRMFITVTYSFRPTLPSDILNLMSKEKWVVPVEGDHHPLFDVLMTSLGGGKVENIDYLERLILHKYLIPEEYLLPCTVIHGEGGVGKNLLVDIVLKTMFGGSSLTASPKDIVGGFNSMIEGKTVILIDESKADKLDTGVMKSLLGKPRVVVNPKGVRQYEIDNMGLYFISSQDHTGGIWLDRSNADRRYSVLFCPRGKTLDTWIQTKFQLKTLDEAIKLRKESINSVFGNPVEIGKWITHLYDKHAGKETPEALHGADFDRLMNIQERMDERICKAVFTDFKFTHINRKTLFEGYKLLCEEYNMRPIMYTKFYEVAREFWTAYELPIEDARNHNTFLFSLKGNKNLKPNDDYYIKTNSFGKKAWNGPEIE